jgi:hypothetical protein
MAMMTALPPNSGGFITTSFTANDGAKSAFSKHFLLSSRARGGLTTKHLQNCGQYVTIKKGTEVRTMPFLLPVSGIDDSSGTEVDVYVGSISNLAGQAKIVLATTEQINGSTVRLVTKEYAKTLPKGFPKGEPFKANTVKTKSITKWLTDKDESYRLLVVPNSVPIAPGLPHTVKGGVDESMIASFAEYSPYGPSWLELQACKATGVFPFDLQMQELVVQNKLVMDQHFPKTTAINYTPSPAVSFTSPPVDDDDDEAIQPAISELHGLLLGCLQRNNPAPSHAPSLPPSDINADLDLIPLATNTTKDRDEAKLRLYTACYSEEEGISLLDVNDGIKTARTLDTTRQAESLCNQLQKRSDDLAESMDAINRCCDFPNNYGHTP